MGYPPLDVFDRLSGISLKPLPIEALGHDAELDNEVTRQVVRFDLTALLLPKMEQSGLVVAHDDPGIRAANEMAAFRLAPRFQRVVQHCVLRRFTYGS